MKKKSLIIFLSATATFAISCKKKGCTDYTANNYQAEAEKDDGTCEYTTEGEVTLNFSHNFDGTAVSSADFDQLNYTNANGEIMSITKMQYLISDVRFYKSNGDSVYFDGYHFIDMEDEASFAYILPTMVDVNSYTGIGFNFGFSPDDNIDGQYTDLNAESWSSPAMLGGGYHQMKFEGRYIDANADTIGFQYHNLSTIREITLTDTIFHDNYASISISKSFGINGNTSIDIQMDINEWFQNPNLWDLNTDFTLLMPNYEAQVRMKENASSVFVIGDITE